MLAALQGHHCVDAISSKGDGHWIQVVCSDWSCGVCAPLLEKQGYYFLLNICWHHGLARWLEYSKCGNLRRAQEYTRAAGPEFCHPNHCYHSRYSSSPLGCDRTCTCA